MKDFDGWNKIKKDLHAQKESKVFYKEREIWFCQLGVNVGFEQDGKNTGFERPVLVLRKFNKYVFWAVPLSTQLKPKNTHYLKLRYGDMNFSAIVSQLRLLDARRLDRKLYMLDREQFQLVKKRLQDELYPINKSDFACAKSSEPEGHCAMSLAEKNDNVNQAEPGIIKTDPGEPRSSGPEGVYKKTIANTYKDVK